MNLLFFTFINKLPTNIDQLLPSQKKYITFLNPYSLFAAQKYSTEYANFDYIASDGILPVWINSLFKIGLTQRYSFDMTSVASEVFRYSISHQKSLYFLGTTPDNIEKFIKIIKYNYPTLSIVGWHHGYIDSLEAVWKDISMLKPDIIIIGMGTPKQDLMALELKKKKYWGCVYTCGGFMHQTITKMNYYPTWVDKFNLRSIYRFYKEPHIFKRCIKTYPRFIILYSLFLIRKKLFFCKRPISTSCPSDC